MEIKSIAATYLEISKQQSEYNSKFNEHIEQNKNNDIIHRLMTNNEDQRELTDFVQKLAQCLAEDGVFPPTKEALLKRPREMGDVIQTQNRLTLIVKSNNLVLKRALIWCGLRISVSFVKLFCPAPDPSLDSRFLVDPDKLSYLIRGHDKFETSVLSPQKRRHQPVRFYLSAFINGTMDVVHMVTSCCIEWFELKPWDNYEQWSSLSPNMPSTSLLKSRRHTERMFVSAAPSQTFLEDGGGKPSDEDAALDWE